MPTIINVSNRLPVTVGDTIRKSSGGLVTAMEGLTGEDASLKWIGWPGGVIDDPARQAELDKTLRQDYGYTPVFLTEEEVSLYYHGYANSSLWPVLHYMPIYMRHEIHWWDAYRRVNERFADVVAETVEDGDLVWVHDYHLMLLPAMLRERRPKLRIGFFLHTPFPSYEVFRCHPQRLELLEGLLGCDQVGFHTFGYMRHFRSAVLRVLGIEPEMNHIPHSGRTTHIGVYPIGINAKKFEDELASPKLRKQIEEYREVYHDRRLVLSVERLDYTKGIVHRLAAIDRFLEKYPDRSHICFLMISVPSRGEVQEYQELRDEVEQLVGKINGRHATVDNAPVHFIFQSVDFTQLCALYCMADVAMVTPLIDGMNLVAKEFVACRKDETGVLILSEFAGAAEELFDAITVNPYDVHGVAGKIREALDLSSTSRKGRMRQMRQRVLRYDANYWAKSFMKELQSRDMSEDIPIEGPDAHTDILTTVRERKGRSAFCLDYDGTLREFETIPDAAEPTPAIRQLLQRLDDEPEIDVFIVSGRREDDLERWLGMYRFTLVGEHGMRRWMIGASKWENAVPGVDLSWKEEVLPVLKHYEDSTPGSRVEEKRSTVVWHYRRSDPEFGSWKANQLMGELYEVISNLPVEIHHGKAIVEVSSLQITKGAAMEHLLAEQDYGLVLCAGDDQTDESMFTCSLEDLVSIKVGQGATAARYRVLHPREMRLVLNRILDLYSEA